MTRMSGRAIVFVTVAVLFVVERSVTPAGAVIVAVLVIVPAAAVAETVPVTV